MTALFQTLPDVIGHTRPCVYDLLRDGLARTPGITALVILSNDGIAQAAYGLDTEAALRTAAACASVASLTGRIAVDTDAGQVLHTAVTMTGRSILVSSCGNDSTLLVVLAKDAPVGLALSEVVRQARAFADQIATSPRFPQAARS